MRSRIEYLLPKCLLTEVAACRQWATGADVAIVGLEHSMAYTLLPTLRLSSCETMFRKVHILDRFQKKFTEIYNQ